MLALVGIVLWSSDGGGDDIAVGAVLVALGVFIGVLALLVMRSLSGIFGVALYRYASGGEPVGGFTGAELESAVRTR